MSQSANRPEYDNLNKSIGLLSAAFYAEGDPFDFADTACYHMEPVLAAAKKHLATLVDGTPQDKASSALVAIANGLATSLDEESWDMVYQVWRNIADVLIGAKPELVAELSKPKSLLSRLSDEDLQKAHDQVEVGSSAHYDIVMEFTNRLAGGSAAVIAIATPSQGPATCSPLSCSGCPKCEPQVAQGLPVEEKGGACG